LLLCGVLFLFSCSAGVYHTVKPGQTLYRIGKTYNVDQHYLARINGITDPDQVRTGTRLYIPGANSVKTVAIVKPRIAASSTAEKVTTQTTSKPSVKEAVASKVPAQTKAPVEKPATTKTAITPKKSATKVTAPSKNILRWPLQGEIISSFSPQVKAGHGRGIEISVRSGSSVAAAAAGKVIYSGDGVNGYGHLIILQHEKDLFTVYGFNQKNFASLGDFVSQGERIALSGTPPSGGSGRLHFEVRRGKQPVDPILYLP
jgi:lipoprotein NlpD